jgi:hypothetical protein
MAGIFMALSQLDNCPAGTVYKSCVIDDERLD